MPQSALARAIDARRLSSLGLSLSLALAALLALGRWASGGVAASGPAAPHGPAASFVVTTPLDAPDNDLTDSQCHIAPAGPCSLRAAVQQLDHDSGGFIDLPGGTFTLTDSTNGDLQLRKDIHLSGVGSGLTIIQGKPNWAHRILRIQDGAQTIIAGMTISGGQVPTLAGGGIDVVSGTVIAIDVHVMNNQAGNGGGLYNAGLLEMYSSRIENNVAITDGGGIYNEAPVVPGTNLILSTGAISNNTAGQGGGLYNLGTGLVVTSTFNHNTALAGGGLSNKLGARLDILASTISNNSASLGDGGGLFNGLAGSVVYLTNSTVSSNRATLNGGGLANSGGSLNLGSVTAVYNATTGSGHGGGLYNIGGTFRLRDSLIALNSDASLTAPDCGGAFTSDGYNLVLNTLGCDTGGDPTNVTGQDPQLTGFAAYGGPTSLWGLASGSPAVDAGDPAGCHDSFNHPEGNDQRGLARAFDGDHDGVTRCDIGAFELQLSQRMFLALIAR